MKTLSTIVAAVAVTGLVALAGVTTGQPITAAVASPPVTSTSSMHFPVGPAPNPDARGM